MEDYLLGVDLGTGSTKAVALRLDGTALYATQEYYESTAGPGSIDPAIIWDAFAACIRNTVSVLGKPPMIVALSSAMHSIMAVDEKGNPLSALLTWADDRAAAIADELRQQPLGRQLYEQCGTPVHALSPLCKVRWWRQHDPELHQQASYFVGVKEWIWHRLFGVYEIDYSLASATGMWDLHTKNWHTDALHFTGIGPEKLARTVDTQFTRYGLGHSAAETLGLPIGQHFMIGASDGCLANLGTAALEPGTAAITIGTSGAVRTATNRPRPVFPEQLFNYYLSQNCWITGGAINNGGAALQWITRLLGSESISDAQVATITAIEPGAGGVLFLPYLLGERAPLWDSNSSAAFIGLRQHHEQAHLLRAVIEGVCFALRSVLAPLEAASGNIKKLHLSGGFTRSDAALQVLADCLGKKVLVLQTEDASAIGAALLALAATNQEPLISTPQVVKTFEPNPVAHARYNELFTLYTKLYPVLKETMYALRAFA